MSEHQGLVATSTLNPGITVAHDLDMKNIVAKSHGVPMLYIVVMFLRTNCPFTCMSCVALAYVIVLLDHSWDLKHNVAWSPYLKQDTLKRTIEHIQRRLTKRSYEHKCFMLIVWTTLALCRV